MAAVAPKQAFGKAALKARETQERVDQLVKLVQDGTLYVAAGKSQALNPDLQKILLHDAKGTSKAFREKCDGDDVLRRKALDQGLDPREWEESLNND